MLALRTYYSVKPFLPSAFRLMLRRLRGRILRGRCSSTWPINPSAAAPPPGWPGWPHGKKFALVLTHDIEGQRGLDLCRPLAKLESVRGFRSSFNLIPEGDYTVPASLRESLAGDGFEIGVHDLKHDGKLYWSRSGFRRQAASINRYLREWGAVGFRSGFMHHNLDWLHDLDVAYDSSTFDTDPFEPQPDGVNTIFPFWVPRPPSLNPQPSTLNTRHGYIELPYTLAQDYNLFLVLRERTITIWKQKLDWVAQNGGMALLDVHPDYMDFNGSAFTDALFPASLYEEFLDYVRQTYAGHYWHALPRDVADYYSSVCRPPSKLIETDVV